MKFTRYILAVLVALAPLAAAAQNGPNATYNALSVRTITATQTITATSFVGAFGGNAATASKLATPRTLGLTGDGTALLTFDGSANASAALTLSASGVTAGSYGTATAVPAITVDAKGRLTAASATPITFPVSTVAGRTGAVTLTSSDLTDSTAFGRTLLGAASATAARSSLSAAASGVNPDITQLIGLTQPITIAQGGTTATSAAQAIINLGAAARGANSDITSLSGLTTPLSLGQGGTGATSAVAARVSLGASGLYSISGATSSNDQATNGTTEFVHTNGLALPANFLTGGKVLRLTVPITIATGSAPSTYQIKVRLDGVPLFVSGTTTPIAANQSGLSYDLVFRTTVFTAGATGTADTRITSYLSASNSLIDNNLLAQPVTIDTTAAHTLQVSTKWSATFSGTGANSISVVRPFLEALN